MGFLVSTYIILSYGLSLGEFNKEQFHFNWINLVARIPRTQYQCMVSAPIDKA